MEKIMNKFNEFKKARELKADEAGFSLLELVVAVGILLVLTVGGLLAYNGITQNARSAAVASAASEIYTGGMAEESDNDTSRGFVDAADDWANSAEGDSITVETGKSGDKWAVRVSHENEGVDPVVRGVSDAEATAITTWTVAGD